MSADPIPAELEELLTLNVLEGLDTRDERLLQELLAKHRGVDPERWEQGATSLHLALVREPEEPVPTALRARLSEDARRVVARGPTAQPSLDASSAAPRSWNPAWFAWGIAAAAVLVLALQLVDRGAPSLETQLTDLIAQAGVVRTAWSAGEDPLATGVTGEVVWSETEDRGFMRFRALDRNDPLQKQYQLWIFDGTRPSETPVDGGVFDVTGDDVIVPIHAKIDVREATLFAVTLEEPGGVVVSKRERLLLTAAVE